jgi:hypothetical protein
VSSGKSEGNEGERTLLERLVDASIGGPIPVNDLAKDRGQDGVEDNVGRVKEGHDGAEGRDVVRLEVHRREGALDVRRERHVSGGPSEGDGDEAAGDLPRPADILGGGLRERGQDPNDVEGERVETEPGEGSGDIVAEQKDSGGTKELAKVGSTDDDWEETQAVRTAHGGDERPKGLLCDQAEVPRTRLAKAGARVDSRKRWRSGGDMSAQGGNADEGKKHTQGNGVSGEQPDETPVAEHNEGTETNRLEEEVCSVVDGNKVAAQAKYQHEVGRLERQKKTHFLLAGLPLRSTVARAGSSASAWW